MFKVNTYWSYINSNEAFCPICFEAMDGSRFKGTQHELELKWPDSSTLGNYLLPFENLALECDGLTRVISSALTGANIPHKIAIGSMQNIVTGKRFSLHFWIVLPDNYFIDFRARMWLGDDSDVPHGVFNPSNWANVSYEGELIEGIDNPNQGAEILAQIEGVNLSYQIDRLRRFAEQFEAQCPVCGEVEGYEVEACRSCGHCDGNIRHEVVVLYRFGYTEIVWSGWKRDAASKILTEWVGAIDTVDCWIEIAGIRSETFEIGT
ncbi:hypothetical protein [Paenibacillus sp. Leaf72]|uniref:hypothetical protein n=1 Tax=Paenibacillus sp. Leaf72 TaxID=1736234 RepID=UPI0012DDF560|nr:hypothetical protein [Paenibacillus sp. Leaf72]